MSFYKWSLSFNNQAIKYNSIAHVVSCNLVEIWPCSVLSYSPKADNWKQGVKYFKYFHFPQHNRLAGFKCVTNTLAVALVTDKILVLLTSCVVSRIQTKNKPLYIIVIRLWKKRHDMSAQRYPEQLQETTYCWPPATVSCYIVTEALARKETNCVILFVKRHLKLI